MHGTQCFRPDREFGPLVVRNQTPPSAARVARPGARGHSVSQDRMRTYERMRRLFLVHVLTPSIVRGQKYDIYIYVKRHRDVTVEDGTRRVLLRKILGQPNLSGEACRKQAPRATLRIRSILCTCQVTFKDGVSEMLYRYVDFEMGGWSMRR